MRPRHRVRKLGQHLLVDARAAERIVGYAALRGDEVVLEVGPGEGILTRALAARAARVLAVERAPEMVDRLEDAGLPRNVEVVLGDAREVELPPFDKVVSNLPYGISSAITFRLLGEAFELGVLTYQREFAERLVARPGSAHYGRLTVNASVRADVELLEVLPPSAFRPRPKVAGAVVRLRPLAAPRFPIRDPRLFEAVVRAAFQHRRKTLRNALLDAWPTFAPSRAALLAALPALPHLERRPQTMGPEEFNEAAEALGREGFTVRGAARGRAEPQERAAR